MENGPIARQEMYEIPCIIVIYTHASTLKFNNYEIYTFRVCVQSAWGAKIMSYGNPSRHVSPTSA